MPRLSVITVVYNDAENLRMTLDNVAGLKNPEIEHVVVDGGSSDGTLEVCHEYSHIRLISEPDKGIYDAMNKGLKMASGDWVVFLNGGDVFVEPSAVESALAFAEKNSDCDILFFASLRDMNFRNVYVPRVDGYRECIPCAHNSCFLKRTVHLQHLYDLRYKIAADYNMMYELLQGGCKWAASNAVLCSRMSGGISDLAQGLLRKEWILVKCRGNKWRVPFYLMGRLLVKVGMRFGLKGNK